MYLAFSGVIMSFLFCVCVFSHSKTLMINLHCFHCCTQPTVQHSSIITVSKEVKLGVSKGHAFLFNSPFFVPNLDTFVFSSSEYAISKLITGILWKIWSVGGSKRRQWSRFYCLTVKSTEAETMKKKKKRVCSGDTFRHSTFVSCVFPTLLFWWNHVNHLLG